MYTRVTIAVLLLYEYRRLVVDVSAVCSVYATSWYPLLLVLMLVFDGAGIHNDPEFQVLFCRTEIRELLICPSTGTRFVYPG